MARKPIRVSVIIKALNEELKIARTIESALQAVSVVGGEVILADSHSTDRTVEIAKRYPIKIVKLSNAKERCCGIGGQIGYQESSGSYVWIVDGDMELSRGFLEDAIKSLEQDSQLAGVSGRVVERNLESLEFRARVQRAPENLKAGIVDRLDGGGVYRRSAIESVGYFTNRNLHSYEEYELAVRLRSAGWRLKRLPTDAVFHFGHTTEAFSLLIRRWNSGYVRGIGELLRGAIGKAHLKLVLKEVREMWLYGVVILWWLVILSILAIEPTAIAGIKVALVVMLAPIALMILKKRSLVTGIYSVVSWNFYAAGLILGVIDQQSPPNARINVEVVDLHCFDLTELS